MGIGGPQATLCGILKDRGLFDGMDRVVELGSQEVATYGYHRALLQDVLSRLGAAGADLDNMTSEEFHRHLGFTTYRSIDADGARGALALDLNTDMRVNHGFTEQFDLVTDYGTSEHVFNVFECFRNAHNLCRVDGLMIHVLPFEGQMMHGFYNFKPGFYYGLSLANAYKIEGMYYMVSPSGAERFKYGRTRVPIEFHATLFDVLAEKFEAGEFPSLPMGNDGELLVVLRKTKDEEFQTPFDTLFKDVSKLQTLYPSRSEHLVAFQKRSVTYTDEILAEHFFDNRNPPIKHFIKKLLIALFSERIVEKVISSVKNRK